MTGSFSGIPRSLLPDNNLPGDNPLSVFIPGQLSMIGTLKQ
jgi:hypothetical protein